MTKRWRFWTPELAREDALRFTTRTAWLKGSSGAYSFAQQKGILDFCCTHMERQQKPNGYWTLDRCKAEASKYVNMKAWKEGHQTSLTVAQRNGWLDKCRGHMELEHKPQGYWSRARCVKDAAGYTSRSAWNDNSISAYCAAKTNGWLDECCAHMPRAIGYDNDAVYIWEAEGAAFNGCKVYKIGVTSARLNLRRIETVEKASGFTAKLIALVGAENATRIEAKLLKIGADPKYTGFDGCTEFRALEEKDLQQILKVLHKHKNLCYDSNHAALN